MQARGSRAGVSQNRQSLMEDLKHGDVVLFLGAGVSAGPASSWSSFLECLVDSAVELGLAGKRTTAERKSIKTTLKRGAKAGWSPYAQAELVKRFLGRRYLGELRRALSKPKRQPSIRRALGATSPSGNCSTRWPGSAFTNGSARL